MDSFIHPELNEKVEFFGGEYLFLEEATLNYHGEEVLYLKGVAALESSCCGRGGCAFIKVAGFVRSWKKGQTEVGRPVSEIERIEAGDQQKEIREILTGCHPGFSQVEFL